MKFTIEKNGLLRELQLLQQNVIDRRGSIPALSHILLEASGKSMIRLTGTDLDQTLGCETEGTVEKQGRIALPGRKLFEIVKNLPDAIVRVETKANNRVEIECEHSQFKVAALDAKEYPELPKFKTGAVQLPSEIIRTMIERTRFSITTDESRYTLCGAKFMLRKKGARMVTTDGHRLSLIDNRSVRSAREFDCLIPKKALSAIYQLAAAHEGEVGVSVDENHIYFEIGARTLVSRLLGGQFPNYEQIIPKSNDQKVKLDCGEFLQVVRRVAVMTDERSRAICLEFKPKQLRVFTEEDGQGAAEETLEIVYEGSPTVIGLNANYLAEYLSVIGDGSINFEFKSAREVVQLRPTDEAEYDSFALIMPMSLSRDLPAQAAKTVEATPSVESKPETQAIEMAA
jgi:DNA polymerase-3 subunit beta